MSNLEIATSPNPKVNQKEEIEKIFPGPILLLAGPGTGKTHTLARRIKYFVEEKSVDPSTITVITFTTEAAKNMRDRLSDEEKQDVFLSPDRQPELICTMNSLGNRIIGENLSLVGLKADYEILSSEELRTILMEDAAQLCGEDRGKGNLINELKRKSKHASIDDVGKKILDKYQQILMACNAIDFDDQILLANKILKENPTALAAYQQKTRYLLVDEYQDINEAQFELIKLLSSGQEAGLFVVGDDDQSIYSFRGGDPQYIRNFTDLFKSSRIEKLDLYRRTPKKFLKGAMRIVEKYDGSRIKKPEEKFKSLSEEKIIFHNVPSQEKEAEIAASLVKKSLPLNNVLVLVPNVTFADLIKKALRMRKIHYFCKTNVYETGLSLFDTVRKFLEDSEDNFSLRLCIHALSECKSLGIPSSKVKKAERKEERAKSLKQISNLWIGVIENGNSLYSEISVGDGKHDLIQKIHACLSEILQCKESNAEVFLECIARLFRPWSNVAAFQKEIRKWLEEAWSHNQAGEVGVRILTLQAAKGLEAEIVLVIGLSDGIFPRNRANDGAIIEQARLFYVSMTRAKKELHLFHARKRDAKNTYLQPPKGQKFSTLSPSPFVTNIPSEFLETRYMQSNSAKKKQKKND